MLAAALPVIGALYGGYEGYKQSGGNLGAAALSAGLSAAGGKILPGAIRFAGSRLASTGLGSAAQQAATRLGPEAYKASQIFAREGASTLNPIAQQALGRELLKKGLAGTALLAGGAAIPVVAGSLSSATKEILPTAGKAVGTGETIRGYWDRKTNTFVPDPTDPLGGTGLPMGPQTALDYLNPLSGYQGQLSLQQQQQDVALKGAVDAMNAMRPYLEESKSKDFRRNVAAARLGTDLATQQALIEGGQRIAGTMGTQALGEVGAGLRTQYRYL
jgi:hypothetical protein